MKYKYRCTTGADFPHLFFIWIYKKGEHNARWRNIFGFGFDTEKEDDTPDNPKDLPLYERLKRLADDLKRGKYNPLKYNGKSIKMSEETYNELMKAGSDEPPIDFYLKML